MKGKVHLPVLLDEVIAYLKPRSDELYVDCTFGNGGYSESILRKADSTIYAFDLDPEALHDILHKTKCKHLNSNNG